MKEQRNGRLSRHALFASLFLRWWKADVIPAFKGLERFDYCVLGFRLHNGMPVKNIVARCGSVYSESYVHAVDKVSEIHPDHPIHSLVRSKTGVCIKLLIAYPCRAARWVWSHRQMRCVELQAVNAMLRIQTRKAVLREIKDGSASIYLSIPADAPDTSALPLDIANGTVGFWDSVSVDDHLNSLANVLGHPAASWKPEFNLAR